MVRKILIVGSLLAVAVVASFKVESAFAITVNCQTQSDLTALEGATRAYAGEYGSASIAGMVSECEYQIQAYQDSLVAPTITPAPSYSQEQLLLQEQSQLNAVCTNNFGPYSQFNNATNQCSCNTGYAIGSDAKCDIVCPTGEHSWNNLCLDQFTYGVISCNQTMGSGYHYSTSTNSCVSNSSGTPSQAYCTENYGSYATVGPVVAGYLTCINESGQDILQSSCAPGYAWNSTQDECLTTAASTTPPVLNINNLPPGYSVAGTASSTSPSFTISQNLSVGASGSNVVSLQQFLDSKGFLTIPTGTDEGYFGKLTKQALVAFQNSVGLPSTGYCGPMTRAAIANGQ